MQRVKTLCSGIQCIFERDINQLLNDGWCISSTNCRIMDGENNYSFVAILVKEEVIQTETFPLQNGEDLPF